jgi:hypothetical protein
MFRRAPFPRCPIAGWWILAAAWAVVWCCVSWQAASEAFADGLPHASRTAARLHRVLLVPEISLAEGVRLGGLSDLSPARAQGRPTRFWTLTDRGPNGSVERDGRKHRTLVSPGFVPTLLLVEIGAVAPRGDHPAGEATIVTTIPLATPSGDPVSGRPLPGLSDDAILNPADAAGIPPHADGIDSEAVVEMANGSFWLAEEYGPSLLHVAAEGRVIARHFPAGMAPQGAAAKAHETLPAEYARRRENRGFEALAASADGARLFALLQSPLDNPKAKAAKKTGNVRLLVFDTQAGRPEAEHVYRLGDPAEPEFLSRGAPPDDGKLSAVATIDDDSLLVLEQADGGLARLYVASLAGATDTLAWRPGKDQKGGDDAGSLEKVRNLEAAGIVPLGKTLVADLGGLLPEIEATVYGGKPRSGKLRQLKLEGIAIIDERHVAIVNDNDFGVHVKEGEPAPRSCLFVIELAEPLPRRVAAGGEPSQNAGR